MPSSARLPTRSPDPSAQSCPVVRALALACSATTASVRGRRSSPQARLSGPDRSHQRPQRSSELGCRCCTSACSRSDRRIVVPFGVDSSDLEHYADLWKAAALRSGRSAAIYLDRSARDVPRSLAAAGRLSGFARLQDLASLSTPKLSEREDRRQVLRTRARLALLPVVDRLRRRSDQKAAFGC
jgi:hypothetical protein